MSKHDQTKKMQRQENLSSVLPSLKCVRDNHRLLAAYCESRVAKELLESENAVLIPDGTARQGVGQIAASILKVGEKI